LALFDFIGTQLAECYRELGVVSQVGADMSRFASVKHFTSWLGLCPDTKITARKVMSGKSKRCVNRASQVLRLAAAALRSSKSALGADYRRMCSRMDLTLVPCLPPRTSWRG
jgi:transposase